jgi:aspartyl-tRNA(Asn)/glutamyl-tRNA(Gln) amidotransferase subunit C
MAIDADDVRHLEALAALRLSDEARRRMVADLQRILDYMQQLAAIDVEGVEPTAHAAAGGNVLRPDVVTPSLPVDDALRNAPDAKPPFYRVPRFVGESEAEA